MDILVPHPAFTARPLTVRTASFFAAAKILQGGRVVERARGRYRALDDSGQEVAVRLKGNLLDPVPVVMVGDEAVRLARPLAWYEYAWIGIPILLVFVGGALGAAIGVAATYTSSHILRSSRSTAAKYALSGLVSALAIVAFLIVATLLQSALNR